MEPNQTARKLSLRSISWILGGIGAALFSLGFVVPVQWCMDGCSTGPSYFMLVTGIGLFIDALIVAGVEGARYPATKLTKGAKAGLGWISGLSLFIAVMFSINGWYSVMIMFAVIAAMPFLLVGGTIALIVRALRRRAAKKAVANAEAPTTANKTSPPME